MKLLYFKESEFACKCGCGFGSTLGDISIELLTCLEKIREVVKEPIYITSACRCKKHNTKVGGKSLSKHLTGEAVDIFTKNIKPSKLADIIDSLYPNKYGVGVYKTFTHFDVRKNKVRFNG